MKMRRRKKMGVWQVFVRVYALLFSLFIVFPYFVMFVGSFKNLDEIYRIPATLLPKVWRFSNYIDVWKAVPLAVYFRNSAIIAVGSTVLDIVCAVPAAYAMARMRFPGKKTMMAIVIMTQMFSPVVMMVGIYKIMSFYHLTNSLVGIIFLVAAFNLAFSIWLLRGFFETISMELEEAALIDGCGRVQAMVRIVLPLAAPGIVTAAIFVFIAGWNDYMMSLILIGATDLKSINLGIRAFFGYTGTEWWYVFAISLMATAPILLFFRFIERYMTGGLTAGGVKG